MATLLEAGPIRLAVLGPAGETLRTLVLPPPNAKGGLELSFQTTGAYDYEFEEGGRGTRVIERPHIPKLVCTWAAYNDHPEVDEAMGLYPLGTGNLRRPRWADLVEVTSAPYWGRLRISPGMAAGGFTVSRVDDEAYRIVVGGLYCEQVKLTFHGRDGRATKTLEDF